MAVHASQPPVDRAWAVLLGASLCMFCGGPAVIYFTFGVFLPEIVADTQWSQAAIAATIGPGALIAALLGPAVGRALDKFGVRAVTLIGGPAFALGLALLGLVADSAWSFAFWTLVMWLLTFAGSTIPYAQAVTSWFDKRRGMAIGIMFCCGALGIAAWPPFAAYLIEQLGWRQAYVVIGLIAGAVMFLSGLFLLKNPPVHAPAVSDELPSTAIVGLTLRETIRTARFWKLASIYFLLAGVLAGMAVNFPVILRQRGADAQTAAAIMSVIGMAMAGGRLMLGFALDRWFAPRIAIVTTIIPIAGFIVMMLNDDRLFLTLAAALLGLGLSTVYASAAYVVSRAFGFLAFGAIYGVISLALSGGAAAGPALIGVGIAVDMGIETILLSAIALLVVAILLLLTLKQADLPFGQKV